MTNVEMIDRLSSLATELEQRVYSQTGKNSRSALAQLNRVRGLIAVYLDRALVEDEAAYQNAIRDLGGAIDTLKKADQDIQKVSAAIALTAKVLDTAEQLAKKL